MATDKQVTKAFAEEDKTEFTDMEVTEAMNQTAISQKKVTIRGLGDVILKTPSRIDEANADTERSKAYTRFLIDDTLRTEEEMKNIAEQRGIWTSKHEDDLSKLQEKMLAKQVDLSTTTAKGNKKKKMQKELLDLRREFIELVNKKNVIFSHTVESKATNVWWQYLVFLCTLNSDGERLWTDYDKYLTEASTNTSIELLAEYITFYNGFSDNFFDLWQGEGIEQPESGEKDGV